jgi:hypothetical protein
MYIYNFLLTMADTVTFRNIDLSSWDAVFYKLKIFCLQVKCQIYQYDPLLIQEVTQQYLLPDEGCTIA